MFNLDDSQLAIVLALIPALPLAAALINAAFGKWLLKENSHWTVAGALIGSFVCSLAVLMTVMGHTHHEGDEEADAHAQTIGYEFVTAPLWTWAYVEDAYTPATDPARTGLQEHPRSAGAPAVSNFDIGVTLRADPLTAIMLCMVTFVSSLVVIYASGYMHGDPGYWRFFTYVGLFVFSMTMLVSVSNFLLLYVFWEAVGVCSYLLIGFWYQKPEAAAAGKKAFLVNRVGDFGFAIGVFLIWCAYGTLNFHDTIVPGVLGQARLEMGMAGYVGGGLGLAICLCLLTGACGKSAQFPLHVWLPDAMEGPTPVSALIHAATMVTAGVYMIARCTPLFMASATAQTVVACIGAFTAILAATIALTQTDLKRVLAYSTVSQLGYMFLGLGCGSMIGIGAGMFHLFTHAFFKALLFLCAGSVMHSMGNVIDMRRFGGLRKIMPWTHGTFWFGALALAGVVPFAGFWSKDAIVAAVHERAHDSTLYFVLYIVALVTAFMTAFYTFRALFLTFYGEERVPPEAGHHAHESPWSMVGPLAILAACAAVVGMAGENGYPFAAFVQVTPHPFVHFLQMTPSLSFAPVMATTQPAFHLQIAAVSTIVALSGVGIAAYLYLGHRREVDTLGRIGEGLDRLRGIGRPLVAWPLKTAYSLSLGKFFIDQIYLLTIVWPLKIVGQLAYWIDRWIVDGLVNTAGKIPLALGSGLRGLQIGMVQFYALAMVLGLLVLIGTLMWWPVV